MPSGAVYKWSIHEVHQEEVSPLVEVSKTEFHILLKHTGVSACQGRNNDLYCVTSIVQILQKQDKAYNKNCDEYVKNSQ